MGSDMRALIIDDSSTDQVVLSQLLLLEKIEITQIYDPSTLEASLQDLSDIDIVFVDLEMPNLNGYEVLQILKDYYGDAVPIVACTVHTSEVSTARDLGFHSFIGKPLNGDRFPMHLRRILEGQSVWEI